MYLYLDCACYGRIEHNSGLLPYAARAGARVAEKERIARRAARLVRAGDVILLDAGSTTAALARALRGHTALTVVTIDRKIARELCDMPGVQVILTGGTAHPSGYNLTGPLAEQTLRSLTVDLAFLGTAAADPEFGLTTPLRPPFAREGSTLTWSESQRTLTGIIADDLTGANATGILVGRQGFRTAALTELAWPAGGLPGYDCVVINTESRAVPPAEARTRVGMAARLIVAQSGGRPVGKRIDSTLRGNLGPELEAVLEVLGPGAIAVVTGAFPASGRTTVDGFHYVNGVLLAETPVRHDPLCPVTESHVPTLLAGQTLLPVGLLPLPDVRGGPAAVGAALRALAGTGVRLVCADAVTDADIAALGAGMARSGLTCVAADPGPLTAAFAAALVPHPERRVLVIAGSVTAPSRAQCDRLESELSGALLPVDAGALGAGGAAAAAEVERATAALAAVPLSQQVFGVRTGPTLALANHEQAAAIAAGFAEIAFRAVHAVPGIQGLYASGGDITLAVCRRLGAAALELRDEVLPLAVSARMLGGATPGLALVTKGGLVGGPDAAITCVRHLLREVSRNG